jgi:Thymidylate synthase complementing protein
VTITAKIIADSLSSQDGIRLTTLQLRYPRFIHAEFMTHRAFSRNASSSRAIPVERLIEDVLRDPAMPSFWGANRPGMQAREECEFLVWSLYGDGITEFTTREGAWLQARDFAVHAARAFDAAGYHKQIVNRLLEPFSHINVVVTATEWRNFFALRRHPDAQPEMRILADAIHEAMALSSPARLDPGGWHLPYVDRDATTETLKNQRWTFASTRVPGSAMDLGLVRISAARCARVSYLTYEGKVPTIDADLELHEKLVSAEPMHASPLEHQATPDEWADPPLGSHLEGTWSYATESGNFVGWRQYRKMIERRLP